MWVESGPPSVAMDDDPRIAASFRKRLSLQKEILRWLEEFTDKLHKRADEITGKVHGLLEQATNAEVDLQNTFNYFHSLSSVQCVENRVYDGDETPSALRKQPPKSVYRGLPAQSYELDILPRYKEALSLGLTSYRDHLLRTSENSSRSTVSKAGSSTIHLPHIFGSEEYVHDNSCGLPDDLIMEVKEVDIDNNLVCKTLRSDAGGSTSKVMFNDEIFLGELRAAEKEESTCTSSAALDFKRMLEAALLSPYKLYEDFSSQPAAEGCSFSGASANMGKDYESANLTAGTDAKYSVPIGEKDLSVVKDDLSTIFDGQNIHLDVPFSALISGGLFDSDDMPSPLGQEQILSSSYSFAQATAEGISKLKNGNISCGEVEGASSDASHTGEATGTILPENSDRHGSSQEIYPVTGCQEPNPKIVKELDEELRLIDDAITELETTKGASGSDWLSTQTPEVQRFTSNYSDVSANTSSISAQSHTN